MKKKLLYLGTVVLLISLCFGGPPSAKAQVPFSCSSDAYQLVRNTNLTTSILYKYNVNTGARSILANVATVGNGIGFNPVDNLLWGYSGAVSGSLVRIDAQGNYTTFAIPNLPADNYIIGDITSDGYLFLQASPSTRFYVVDLNPARTGTFLKLVNPTTGYTLQTSSPYGTAISYSGNISSATYQAADWAYNASDGNFYTVNAGTSTAGIHKHMVLRLNPTTGVITGLSKAAGGGIQNEETDFFGATFFDASGFLYAFGNGTGKFFKINTSTYVTTHLSTSTPSNSNDGASCASAILTSTSISGIIYDDANGVTDNTVNGTTVSSLASNDLFVSLVNSSNQVVASKAVVNGVYSFEVTPNTNYTVVLSNTIGTVGQAPPSTALSNEVEHVGENIGLSAGNDGATNGISNGSIAVAVGTSNIDYVNFGIDVRPVVQDGTDPTIHVNPGGATTVQVSSTVYTGTDSEDGTYPNNLTNRTVTLSPATGGTLYYNSAPVLSSSEFTNFNPSLVTVDPTSLGETTVTYPYTVKDNAGLNATPATVTVRFADPLPVNLISFTGKVETSIISLAWSTSEEINSQRFEIQRSSDLQQWNSIGELPASVNSNAVNHYVYTDHSPNLGQNYYRLKMIDIDQSFAYSSMINFNLKDAGSPYLYPNPAQNELRIQEIDPSRVASIEILNGLGGVVSTYEITTEKRIPLHQLSSGKYMLRVIYKNGEKSFYKFIKAD
ncbi:T9SS type A sorting domain-containing protein [Dyadobacter tibetensis]|uniref:T9SS type A sorting domain-containing protein n=1 Tax=Dyadobacter tibetensis TaxID=1211851 RepID=UPI0018DD94A7|nr:T9SS type A sorting domain-containing protein [Dyadobacter tibetensis]